MLKNFFSSAWPAVVTLCVGVLTFFVGCIFGQFLPETWLQALAWVSSIALFLGLLFAVSNCPVNESFFDKGMWLVIGSAVSMLLLSCGWANKEFIDIPVFIIPSFGTLCLGAVFCTIGAFKESEFFHGLFFMVLTGIVCIIFKELISGMALKEMLEYALLVLLAGFVIFAVWLVINKYQEGKKKLIVQEK